MDRWIKDEDGGNGLIDGQWMAGWGQEVVRLVVGDNIIGRNAVFHSALTPILALSKDIWPDRASQFSSLHCGHVSNQGY